MEIILGKYCTRQFSKMIETRRWWSPFPFTPLLGNVPALGIIEIVHLACGSASKINFLLDGLSLPLSESSWTCLELDNILKNESFSEKTQFWLKGRKLVTCEVVSKIGKHSKNKTTISIEDIEFSNQKNHKFLIF